MSKKSSFRIFSAAVLVACVASAVTVFGQTRPASAPATAPAVSAPTGASVLPSTAPAAPAYDPNAPIAIINGKDINNALFNGILMQVSGMRVFQQVFDLALVQQDCATQGVNVDLLKEYDHTLDGITLTDTDSKPVTDKAKKEMALNQLISQQGLTGVEFRLRLETQAGLRALSAGRITVTDEEVKDAYAAQYGEKRTVHLITVKDTAEASQVRTALDAKTADGKKKNAVDVGNELKLNVSQLVLPKSAKADKTFDAVVQVIRETLKTEGQLSAMVTMPDGKGGTQNVLVYLDAIDTDKTAANPFDKVKEDVRKNVFNFKESQWMTDHLTRLRAAAVVKINDPVLSEQFANIDRNNRAAAAAAAAAATQSSLGTTPVPATAPATATKPANNALVAPKN